MKNAIAKSVKKTTNSKLFRRILITGAAAAATAAAAAIAVNAIKKHRLLMEGRNTKNLSRSKNIYISGNSLASLTAAAYLIKDGGYPGKAIHIYGMPSAVPTEEYGSIGPFTKAFLHDIDALDNDDFSLDTMLDNIKYTAEPNVKVIDGNGNVRTLSLKLDKTLIKPLSKIMKKLSSAAPDELNSVTIAEAFGEIEGFETSDLFNFIEMTFGVRLDNKVSEFLARAEQLITYAPKAGLYDTMYYDFSMMSVLSDYLESHGADIHSSAEITGVDADDDRINAIHLINNGTKMTIYLNKEDFAILDTGTIFDGATEGSYNSASPKPDNEPQSMTLWKNASECNDNFGLPELLTSDVQEAMEFSIVDDNGYLLKKICEKIGEEPDNGISVLFENSNWRMKLTSEPYSFIPSVSTDSDKIRSTVSKAMETNGDIDETDITPEDIETAGIINSESEPQPVITVKGVYTGSEGNYINKTMRECTGVELLYEVCCHLGMVDTWENAIDRIKVVMVSCQPYKFAPLRKAPKYAVPSIRPCENCVAVSDFIPTEAPSGTIEQQMQSAKRAVNVILGKKDKKIRPKLVDVKRL